MDSVDDRQPHFASLEDLGLPQEDTDLLAALTSRFREVRYFVLERGLSSAIKTVAKPKTLFPLLVKIDCREKVEAEAAGDTLLRDRVPPMSLPPLEAVRYGSTRGGIAYRYVTGGRVRDLARRFDTALLTLPTYRALQVIDDIFDVILKKCHWLDGQFEMRGVQLPAVSPSSDSADDPTWQRLRDAYERATNICHSLKAPHGIVHGDLHVAPPV